MEPETLDRRWQGCVWDIAALRRKSSSSPCKNLFTSCTVRAFHLIEADIIHWVLSSTCLCLNIRRICVEVDIAACHQREKDQNGSSLFFGFWFKLILITELLVCNLPQEKNNYSINTFGRSSAQSLQSVSDYQPMNILYVLTFYLYGLWNALKETVFLVRGKKGISNVLVNSQVQYISVSVSSRLCFLLSDILHRQGPL